MPSRRTPTKTDPTSTFDALQLELEGFPHHVRISTTALAALTLAHQMDIAPEPAIAKELRAHVADLRAAAAAVPKADDKADELASRRARRTGAR